ncbi:Eukaryotic translation initiation factor 4E-binding protein Mextli [Nymphon striatum]|nr:Eukaryotic translation initiation factor 4E-binding protein Mextli [Nymphon striatum]
MSTTALLTTRAIRNTRKIERPRPLRQDSKRSSTIVDDPLTDLENLYCIINNCNYEASFELVQQACNSLKKYGAQLETKYKGDYYIAYDYQLDRYFVTFRDASRDDKLDTLSKLKFLEIIELRARGWKQNDQINNYYLSKFTEIENLLERGPSPVHSPIGSIQQSSSNQNIPLSSGEILKNSGKFSKATKIPGKNYFKDEIMIRNSDSGKVMGIKGRRVHLIEELSDTIISFQRVAQGVKERRVQITGPHEEAIGGGTGDYCIENIPHHTLHDENVYRVWSAKHLIEDTIRRNASPVREKNERQLTKSTSSVSLNSNASDDSGTSISLAQEPNYNAAPIIHSYSATTIRDYEYTVMIVEDPIRISGSNIDSVRAAKLVLEEHFAGQVGSNGYSKNTHRFTGTGSNRRPQSMYSDFGDIDRFNQSLKKSTKIIGDLREHKNVIPLQRSKSIPISTSVSSTEDETFKGDGSSAEDDTNHVDSEILAQYGYSNVPFDKAHHSAKIDQTDLNNSLHSAAFRRAKFAKPSFTDAEEENTEKSSTSNNLSTNQEIRYTRDILLYYAKSPFSTIFPKNLIHIVQDFPYLLKKTPEMFDPDAFKDVKLEYIIPYSYKRNSPPRFSICESVEEEN